MLPHQPYGDSRHLPIALKRATVVMFPKTPRPASMPSKYRPISLLSTLSKVAEVAILHRLKALVDASHALLEPQFGFRQGHFTTQQLLHLTEWTARAFNLRKTTGAVFLIVEEAYNQVWHRGLPHKLSP
ncbi:hypothetical protein Zmor_008995 [Zophobas morio]|jgi:hypothetical protein|uniref:Reverse transcriptase domain-containing protein n=1 Tax=Zophobas morio TaxID=2755281 RepID=A0AA38HHL2_9CUCU|nr:hypothetical protein Zmor_008995 [Zophobas morio]